MISNKNNLLAPKNKRYHALWFSGLSSLVNQNSPKLEFMETWVPGADTSTTNDISILQNLFLGITGESFIFLFVLHREFAEFSFELHQLFEFDIGVVHADLFMEGEEGYWRGEVFARFCSDTDDFET